MRTVRSPLALGVLAAFAVIAPSSCAPHVTPGVGARAICGFGMSSAVTLVAHVTFENTTAAAITVSRYRVTWPGAPGPATTTFRSSSRPTAPSREG